MGSRDPVPRVSTGNTKEYLHYERHREYQLAAKQDHQGRGHFPSDDEATKLIWVGLRNITAGWGRSRLGGGDEPIRYPLCDRFFEHPCECRSEKRGALPRATLCSCTGLWLRLRSLFSLHIPCILDSKITDKFKHFRLTYLKCMLIINNSDTIQSKGRFHHAS